VKNFIIEKYQLARLFIAKNRLLLKPEWLYFWESKTGIPFESGTLESLRRNCLLQKGRYLSLHFTVIENENESVYEEDIQYISDFPELN
jgi:hypothetical protein